MPAPASPSFPPRAERTFAGLLGLVFAISFLKGFRMPNAWAATHFTFNYSQGFVRRGLVGEVARLVAGDGAYQYNVFVLFSFAVFAMVAVAFALLVRRALRAEPSDLGLRLALLAFAASPGVVFFVHAIGYFDHIGLLGLIGLLLVSARARSPYVIFAAAVPVGIVYAFIHECLAVMFAPVMLLAMICTMVARPHARTLSRRARRVLAALAVASTASVLVLSTLVSTLGTKPPEQIHALQAAMSRVVDFRLRPDAFEALYRSAEDNLLQVMPAFWADHGARRDARRAFFVFLPGFVFLLGYGLELARRADASVRARWLIAAVFSAASIGPLSLNLFGWDYARWNGIAVITCFCGIAVMKIFLPPPAAPAPASARLLSLGMAAFALGLCADNMLFDGFAVQLYPFDHQLGFIGDLFQGGFTYRPAD